MLTLIEGGFGAPIQNVLKDNIRALLGKNEHIFLIVPEQQTVLSECEMSIALPDDAPLYFEVTNFTRFTNTAFRELGGISGEYCSPIERSLTMWRALSELKDELTMTRGRRNIPKGIVDKALSAVAEMQTHGITADALDTVITETIPDKRLREKLGDLKKVYKRYSELIEEKYSDSANDALKLYEMLMSDESFLLGAHIFIDGFTSFTEPQYKLIEALITRADVSLTLTYDKIHEAGFEYKEVRKTRERLIKLAASLGIVTKQRKVGESSEIRHPLLCEICNLLWRSDGRIDNDSLQYLDEAGGRVRIFSAPTLYEECDFVAADIKRRVMAGARFSDFAIVARRCDSYLGVLDTALSDADVPFFLSKPKDLGNTSLMKLILSSYSAILYGFRRTDIMSYLKCGLLPLTDDERDRFELYVEKWAIDGRRFTDGIMWNMNPRGYQDARESDGEELIAIDKTREVIIEPLIKLSNAVSSARTAEDHARALLNHLSSLSIEDALARRAEELEGRGEPEAADETRTLWGVICDALDAVVDVIGESICDAESFINQLSVAVSGASVGRIPVSREAVTVGSADMLRSRGKKHIYLIGVNSGEFPATISESSYFGEVEKMRLVDLGLNIEPDLELRGAREFYAFSRAFSSASDTVTLLYCEKTAMLGGLMPSDVIARIIEMTGGRVKPVSVLSVGRLDNVFTPESALNVLGELTPTEKNEVKWALNEAGFGERVAIAEGEIKNNSLLLGGDSLALLYKNDLYLSQTRIDKFLGCPMSYFCQYSLHLDDGEPARLGANIIGSFVHAVLEYFFTEIRDKKIKFGEIDEKLKNDIAEACARRYTKEMLGDAAPTSRTEVTISRLVRATRPVVDGLVDEMAGSRYEPRFFELETSLYDPKAPNHVILDNGGGRVIIRGTIDRVDTFKSGDDVYVRVIDYKTGHNEFLPTKLEDGEYLQMFLYLKAIKDSDKPEFRRELGVGDGGKVIPAGVIYVKTKVGDTTVREASDELATASVLEKQARDGMVLDDPVSLEAMNPNYLPPSDVKGRDKREYTLERWDEIEGIISDLTLSVADDMRSGNIKATPATKGGRNCKWCKYKGICRSAVIKNDF